MSDQPVPTPVVAAPGPAQGSGYTVRLDLAALAPWVVSGACLVAVFCGYGGPRLGPLPTVVPAPVSGPGVYPQPAPSPAGPLYPPYPGPSPALTPLAQALAGHPIEAAELAEFFSAAAEYVPKTTLTTTAALREAYAAAGTAAFPPEFRGRFPGLAAAIDAALQQGLGLEVRPLDAAARTQAAAAYNAIADQLRQVR